jgi:hypothetical protein
MDALTEKLAGAIEKADRLNEEAGMAPQDAIQNATRDMELLDDFRYKSALQMLDA